jgi:PAS domain S-box-containing protein
MATELRKTGISVIDDLPWGTHFCHFYETKEDLADLLIPYFKTGLENNEFCLWVVSDPLGEKEARNALRQAVPEADRYLAAGRIEIVSHIDQYLKGGAFVSEQVINGWNKKLAWALAEGYDGMRVNGNEAWLTKENWKDFSQYEKTLDETLANRRMIVLCSYPFTSAGAAEIFDVVHTHQYAIVRRRGEWEVVESPEMKQAKAEIKRLNEELEQRVVERTQELAAANEQLRREITERERSEEAWRSSEARLQAAIDAAAMGLWDWDLVSGQVIGLGHHDKLFGFAPSEFDGAYSGFEKRVHPEDVEELNRVVESARDDGSEYAHEYRVIWPDGSIHWIAGRGRFVYNETGQAVRMYGAALDITKRRQAEQALQKSESDLTEAQRITGLGSWSFDIATNTVRWSEELYRIFDIEKMAFDGNYETFLARVHPDDRNLVLQVNAEARLSGEPFEVEYRITTRSGQLKHIREIGYARKVSAGLVSGLFGTAHDITERKQAEQALRRSENHLRLVIDTIPTMAWSLRPDGALDFVNQRWLDYTGISLEAAIEQPNDIVHPEDLSSVIEKWLTDMTAGEVSEDEMRLRRADGEYRWFLVRTAPLRDEQGSVIKWYGTNFDITERKQAEALLYAKEQEFRAIVENTPDHIIRYDREFRRTYVNPAVAKAYGLPVEALIGQFVGSVIQDAGLDVKKHELANLRQRIATVFDTGNPYEHEITWPTPTDRRYYWVRFFPEFDLNGSVINVLGISQDITERKQAEEQLRQSESLMAEAQRVAHIGSWNWDLRSNSIIWSNELYRIFGLQPKAINIDHYVMERVHPEDRNLVRRVVEHALKTKESYSFYYRILRPDGEERIVYSRGYVVNDEHGDPIRLFGTTQDVTERKRAEEQLRTLTEQLRALSARLGSAREEESMRIAREIHDELGAALSSLRWDLEEIDEVLSESTDLLRLAALRQRIEAMVRLIDSTVDIVKRIASELRPIALDELGLIEAIKWQAQQFQDRTGIIVECDCQMEDLDLDREVSTVVFRIFQEAMTNILRHAQAKKVDIIIKQEADEFLLMISDNGKGITEDEKSGMQSLGLLGMRERAQLIGGEINVEGAEGQGTVITVRVSIPARPGS